MRDRQCIISPCVSSLFTFDNWDSRNQSRSIPPPLPSRFEATRPGPLLEADSYRLMAPTCGVMNRSSEPQWTQTSAMDPFCPEFIEALGTISGRSINRSRLAC
jgi:hypothetical protein